MREASDPIDPRETTNDSEDWLDKRVSDILSDLMLDTSRIKAKPTEVEFLVKGQESTSIKYTMVSQGAEFLATHQKARQAIKEEMQKYLQSHYLKPEDVERNLIYGIINDVTFDSDDGIDNRAAIGDLVVKKYDELILSDPKLSKFNREEKEGTTAA